jgi:endonuclease YncB( thermonuclease family)
MKFTAVKLYIFFFFILSPSFVFAWYGNVVGVTDGDTVKVLHNSQQVKIRLYGIDALEKKQAFGQKARQFTADMVAAKS